MCDIPIARITGCVSIYIILTSVFGFEDVEFLLIAVATLRRKNGAGVGLPCAACGSSHPRGATDSKNFSELLS